MDILTTIFYIVILIMSVVIHELSHGYMADYLGDPTPRLQGRLTLNPIPHLDMVGSVILPLVLALSGTGFIVGWAKPVEYNPYNIKNRRWGGALIALAGPASNIILALVFGLALRFFGATLPDGVVMLFSAITLINIILAVFNLIPVPPLDGHHVLFAVVSDKYLAFKQALQRYSLVLLLVVIFFLWKFITPLVFLMYNGIVGSTIFL